MLHEFPRTPVAAAALVIVSLSACSSLEQANKDATRSMESTRDSGFVRGVNETLGRWGQWVDQKLGGIGGDDAREIDAEVEKQLDSGEGRSRWRSSRSGASATISTERVAGERSSFDRRVLSEVDIPDNLTEREGVYITNSRTNIRRGPGTRYDVIETVDAGRRVQVTAEAPGRWYMLEQSGTVIGFIYGPLLRPANELPYGAGTQTQDDSGTGSESGGVAPPYGQARQAPSEAPRSGGPTLPYGPAPSEAEPIVDIGSRGSGEARIEVERECREVSITTDSGATDTRRVCRDADGEWRSSTGQPY